MTRQIRQSWYLAVLAVAGVTIFNGGQSAAAADPALAANEVALFDGVDDGQLDARIVVKNDHEARILLTNQTKQLLTVRLPEAFAAVPVVAQFGGGGGGRATGGGGGGQQSAGGGLGGGGGGGGGVFSIPPEETGKINVAVVCLDHGLRDPSSSKPYRLVRAEEHLDRPAVIELLKAFGRGELHHGAAQAATWHLNSDLTWDELAAKQQGTRRNIHRPPYFNSDELRAGIAYAHEATIRAEEAQREKAADAAGEVDAESTPSSDDNSSEERSTQD